MFKISGKTDACWLGQSHCDFRGRGKDVLTHIHARSQSLPPFSFRWNQANNRVSIAKFLDHLENWSTAV